MHFSENESWVNERQAVADRKQREADKKARLEAHVEALKEMNFSQRIIARVLFWLTGF